MFRRLLARFLHYANADPPMTGRREFYAVKQALLAKHGTFHGHDLQHIVKPCWGERRYDEHGDEDYLPCGATCRRCGGTGIFDERWVRLERWTWGRYTFHNPTGDTRKRPDSDPATWIKGRIEHLDYGRASNEAVLWLYLLTGHWHLLGRQLRAGWRCGWYAWPMLNLQRVVAKLSMKLRWQKCWCGRWYPTWGSGWLVCKRCRNRDRSAEEIPF